MVFGNTNKLTNWGSFSLEVFADLDNEFISASSLERVFNYGNKTWLADYLESFQKFGMQTHTLSEALRTPIELQIGSNKIIAYKTTLLSKIAETIIEANHKGFLGILDLHLAQKAQILINQETQIPLQLYTAEITGKNNYKRLLLDRLINQLSHNESKHPLHWTLTIPLSIIDQLIAFYGLSWSKFKDNRNRIGNLLQQYFVGRLPIDVFEEIRTTKPKRSYKRKDFRPQQSSSTKFEAYLTTLQFLLQSSETPDHLEKKADVLFPIHPERQIAEIPDVKTELSATDTFILERLF